MQLISDTKATEDLTGKECDVWGSKSASQRKRKKHLLFSGKAKINAICYLLDSNMASEQSRFVSLRNDNEHCD